MGVKFKKYVCVFFVVCIIHSQGGECTEIVLDHLDSLSKTYHSFIHPSNRGKWTVIIILFYFACSSSTVFTFHSVTILQLIYRPLSVLLCCFGKYAGIIIRTFLAVTKRLYHLSHSAIFTHGKSVLPTSCGISKNKSYSFYNEYQN